MPLRSLSGYHLMRTLYKGLLSFLYLLIVFPPLLVQIRQFLDAIVLLPGFVLHEMDNSNTLAVQLPRRLVVAVQVDGLYRVVEEGQPVPVWKVEVQEALISTIISCSVKRSVRAVCDA
jgi:hypothetical protein